jgi:hypothetical protein
MRAFLPPIRFAKRASQAFNGENRWTLVSSTWATS